ncbi:phosphorylase family protein [Flavobacterium koreense]
MVVFIVDDDITKTTKIEEVLNRLSLKLRIIKSSNSVDALNILLQEKIIDLLILDINLPVREGEFPKANGGLSILNQIIRRPETCNPTSIIGLTAHQDLKKITDKYFNKEGWIIVSYNTKLSDWEDVLTNKLIYLSNKIEMKTTHNVLIPTIVILTAIKPEYLAVRAHLVDIYDNDVNDTSYEIGTFQYLEQDIAKVIIRECGPRNANAAQETERAIQYFSPSCILFVGIAGSRKPNDFKIGDVIFPIKIYSYEGGKDMKNSFSARPEMDSLTYALTEKAKKERLKNDWKSFIKGEYKTDPKADLGIIASGDLLIEHYDSSIGKLLTKHYNDTSAVEMEGFGFAKAVSKQGRESQNIMYGVIRGISDIIGNENLQNTDQDLRPDNAKDFASDSAAAFTYWLIYKIFKI